MTRPMNRDEFLAALRGEIESLDIRDRNRSLDYYREMIDDCIENGMSEIDAVASMGDVKSIAKRILDDLDDIEADARNSGEDNIISSDSQKNEPSPKHEEPPKKEKKSGKMSPAAIALILIGSVVWFPLLCAAVAVLLAVYIVMWAVVLVAYSVAFAFIAATVAAITSAVASVASGMLGVAVLSIGGAFLCLGLSILSVILSVKLTKWTAYLAVMIFKAIFKALSKKGEK